MLDAQFNTLAVNYFFLMQGIATFAPNAKVFTVGYADPFRGLGAANPLLGPTPFTADFPFSTFLTLTANDIIQDVTNLFGYTYIDIYTPFLGNEIAYSQITTLDGGLPNFHPSEAGYQAITNRLITAVAPEPATLVLLLPVVGVVLARRRK